MSKIEQTSDNHEQGNSSLGVVSDSITIDEWRLIQIDLMHIQYKRVQSDDEFIKREKILNKLKEIMGD